MTIHGNNESYAYVDYKNTKQGDQILQYSSFWINPIG